MIFCYSYILNVLSNHFHIRPGHLRFFSLTRQRYFSLAMEIFFPRDGEKNTSIVYLSSAGKNIFPIAHRPIQRTEGPSLQKVLCDGLWVTMGWVYSESMPTSCALPAQHLPTACLLLTLSKIG